jgi:hypothetical protein
MSLVLAIKNHDTVVVAADTAAPAQAPHHFGPFILAPNRSVLLLTGNLTAVEHAIMDVVLPKVDTKLPAAGLAQLVYAALTLDVIPKLATLTGRVEIIVAGIDPIRHIYEPALYYLDSAQNFQLQLIPNDAVAAGSTAAVYSLLAGHSFASSNANHLQVLAKECVAATKLRWPAAIGNHLILGVITPQNVRFQQF